MLQTDIPAGVILMCPAQLILLKERASVFQYAAVLAAFGSSMLIIKPGFSSATFPAIIGLLGGMGAGAAYTCVRALSRKGEKSARIVFFFSMFSTLVCVPFRRWLRESLHSAMHDPENLHNRAFRSFHRLCINNDHNLASCSRPLQNPAA